MKSNYKRLGEYIKEVKVRNADLKAEKLLGINIDKFFMPSVANVVGTELTLMFEVVCIGRLFAKCNYLFPLSQSKKKS